MQSYFHRNTFSVTIKLYIFIFSFFCFQHLSWGQDLKIDSLKQALAGAKNDSLKIMNYARLCYAHYKISPSTATQYGNEGFMLAKKIKNQKLQGVMLSVTGTAYAIMGKKDTAKHILLSSIQASQQSKDLPQEGETYLSLGMLEFQSENNISALAYFEKAFQIFDTLKKEHRKMVALNNIGLIHMNNSNFDKAIQCYRVIQTHAIHTQDKHNLTFANCNLGYAYKSLKQYDSARVYFKIGLSNTLELEDKLNQSFCYIHLGEIATLQNELSLAHQYFDKAQSLDIDKELNENSLHLHQGIASLALKEKQYDAALTHIEEGIQIAKEVKNIGFLIDFLELKSQYFYDIGDFKHAFEMHQRFKTLSDSLSAEDKKKNITQMLAQFEAEKQEKELAQLKKDQEIKSNTIGIQQFVIYASLGTLLFLGILLLVLYSRKKKDEKNLALIAAQRQSLLEKNMRLEEIDEVKNRIFSVISHDIRTPLNSLSGLLDLYDKKMFTDAQIATFFPKLSQNLLIISETLNSLLMWAKNQLEGAGIKPEVIDLKEIVTDNILLLESMFLTKKIEIYTHFDSDAKVFADEEMISTVIRNLLSNAIKFTQEKGKITINGKFDNQQYTLSIQDNGIGIEPENVSKIFSGYKSKRGTNNEKGTGLGLLMAKDFIEKNNGIITVESKVGEGTTFYITLPTQQISHHATAATS